MLSQPPTTTSTIISTSSPAKNGKKGTQNIQTQIIAHSNNITDIVNISTSKSSDANDDSSNASPSSSTLLGRIFLPHSEIDPEALKQVQSMCTHPACSNCRSMPDTCKGNGCCVGFSCQMTECISPQLIGGDIACGISAIPLSRKAVERRNGLERILNVIHAQVPMGSGPTGVQQQAAIRLEQYAPFLEEATLHWRDFNAAYLKKFGVNLDQFATQKYASYIPPPHEAENVNALGNMHSSSESTFTTTPSGSFPTGSTPESSSGTTPASPSLLDKSSAKFQYTLAWLQKRVQEWGITMDQMKCSMLSLGGGNHFIEVGQKTYVLDDHTKDESIPPSNITRELNNNNNSTPSKKKQKKVENVETEAENNNNNLDDDIMKSLGIPGRNNRDRNDEDKSDDSSDDDDDENVSADNLPEYLLSCHTGSRAVGQAIYRHWTKKCAQYQQARIQIQQLNLLKAHHGADKLTAEQLQQLAAASVTLQGQPLALTKKKSTTTTGSVCSATSSSAKKKSLSLSKKKKSSSSSVSNNTTPEKKTKRDDGDSQDDNDDDDQDEENEDLDIVDPLAFAPPEPKSDDDESIPFNTGFLLTSHEDLSCYYMDVIFAQCFASMNRRAILSSIFTALGDKAGKFSEKNMIETVHNYIDFRDFVVRKGAIRAHEGEKVLIGLNMKEGLWLGQGKGCDDWNRSCAHGCGRIMSRKAAGGSVTAQLGGSSSSSAAKNSGKGSNKNNSNADKGSAAVTSKAKKSSSSRNEDPRLKQFKAEMGEVVSQTVNAETFDERPSVYRNSTLVRNLIEPSVDVICRYKTVLNAKGGTGTTM